MGNRPLGQRAATFRQRIIDAIYDEREPERYWHIDRDRVVGVCPACDYPIHVWFHGTAPRANIWCETGCSQRLIIAAIRSQSGWR
jgi:hypothetical protein